jgi:sugar phosphate isomerase/epimerase
MDVQLGCMPRPWNKHSHGDALAGIAAAGFKNYAFLGHKEATVDSETSPENAQQLAAAVRGRGLEPRMIYSATRIDAPEDEVLARVKRLIDNAQRTGATVLIEGGTGKPENFETYFSIMRRAAPYAQEKGVTIALKPHGGISTTGDDTLKAIQAVNHPAYRLCFDPGNLLYYAGLRPEAELPKLAPYVVAMCVKDETGGNGPRPHRQRHPGRWRSRLPRGLQDPERPRLRRQTRHRRNAWWDDPRRSEPRSEARVRVLERGIGDYLARLASSGGDSDFYFAPDLIGDVLLHVAHVLLYFTRGLRPHQRASDVRVAQPVLDRERR